MLLNEQSIAAYKKILSEPHNHGLSFRPITSCFEISEDVTPKHILFNQFSTEAPMCPKLIFYIIMDELYPNLIGKAKTEGGELGFYLKFISAGIAITHEQGEKE